MTLRYYALGLGLLALTANSGCGWVGYNLVPGAEDVVDAGVDGGPDASSNQDGALGNQDASVADDCPDDPGKTEPGVCGCGIADTDRDEDGAPDCQDDCPLDPAKTAVGVCGCGEPEDDGDGDGTPDCQDACLSHADKAAPGVCGCGTPDTDTDGDTAADCQDGCINDAAKTAPGTCGCGVPDADTDTDGSLDCEESCPSDPAKRDPGTCGCGFGDVDGDGDGTLDCQDGCPLSAAKTDPGQCGCAAADTDGDGDGSADCVDGCPSNPAKIAPGDCGCGAADTDSDGDGSADCVDVCADDPLKTDPQICGCGNPDVDTDGNGVLDCQQSCPVGNPKTDPGQCGCDVADTDGDGDGIADCNDGCPNDAGKTSAGLCGCGTPDADGDGDGTADCNDGCPADGNKTTPGLCGCGSSDADSDSDGVEDCNDGCPSDGSKQLPGQCGCGMPDTDGDGDGTADCNDGCPADPGKTSTGTCGCGTPDTDSDSDGVADCNDSCPSDANKTVPGQCACGNPDTDTDGDGTADCNDGCATDPNKTGPGVCDCGNPDVDGDADGTLDCNDGCPADPNKVAAGVCDCGNPDADSDGDGTLDCNDGCPADMGKTAPGVCDCGNPDVDSDGDGTLDCNDGCPSDTNKTAPGVCGCGNPDVDSDSDGTLDCNDGCPVDPLKTTPGACGCGTPEGCGADECPGDPDKVVMGQCGCGTPDTDSDGDGTADCIDVCPDDPNFQTGDPCLCDSDNDGATDCNDLCPGDPSITKPNGNACTCDNDQDTVTDCDDSDPQDEFVCSDTDADGCDDCTSGTYAPNNDGPDPDGDGACNTLYLTPSSVDFGTVDAGATSSPQVVQLENAGTADVTNCMPSLSGTEPGAFSIDSDNCANVSAGGSCNITLSGSGQGAVGATPSATLEVNCDAGAYAASDADGLTMSVTFPMVVEALYPNTGANWLDYVPIDDPSEDRFHQDDAGACVPVAGVSYLDSCVHGGEFRKIVVPGVASCAGLTLTEHLGLFQWLCVEELSGEVVFYSDGLRRGAGARGYDMGIADAIDFTATPLSFLDNWVSVSDGAGYNAQTEAAVWWSNTLHDAIGEGLITSATPIMLAGGGINDIYVITGDVATNGIRLAADHTGLVVQPGRATSSTGATNSLCNYNHAGGSSVVIVDGSDFAWIEGDFVHDTTGCAVVNISRSTMSRLNNVDTRGTLSHPQTVGISVDLEDIEAFYATRVYEQNPSTAYCLNQTGSGAVDVRDLFCTYGGINAKLNFDTGRLKALGNLAGTLTNVMTLPGGGQSAFFVTNATTVSQSEGISRNAHFTQNLLAVNGGGALRPYWAWGAHNFQFNPGTHVNLASVQNTSVVLASDNSPNPLELELYFYGALYSPTNCVNRGYPQVGFDTACNPTLAQSTAVRADPPSMADLFVGPIGREDTVNQTPMNAQGEASYSSSNDFVHFENSMRAWSTSLDSAVPRGTVWSSGTAAVWDFSLRVGADSRVFQRNPPITPGATCPAEVAGNRAHTTMKDGQVFLENATELFYDYRGDDDGLCESDEACLYTPNIGAYQGHGTLETCIFDDAGGPVTGVSIYAWSENGR